MKILVTGGSGFLGSHVADLLSKLGHDVTIYDKKQSAWLRQDQKMIVGDLLDVSSLEKAISASEAVYHFAALADINEALKRPIETANINISGTVLALELSCKYKIKRELIRETIFQFPRRTLGIKRYSLLRRMLFGEKSDSINKIFEP